MQVHDPGEVLDDPGGHAAADVARDDRFPEPDAEGGRGLHARVDAGDQVQLSERDEGNLGDVAWAPEAAKARLRSRYRVMFGMAGPFKINKPWRRATTPFPLHLQHDTAARTTPPALRPDPRALP
ncbi:hypothetical protein GCM10009578_031350 [Streptomyces rhizosphaericus]